MRQKVVVGNWKMHTTAAEAKRSAKALVDGVGIEDRVCVAICPPFPYLALVGAILKGSRIALGAQNLYPEKEGAFSGEINPTMLLDLACKYVILGHSERQYILRGTDAFINQKVKEGHEHNESSVPPGLPRPAWRDGLDPLGPAHRLDRSRPDRSR